MADISRVFLEKLTLAHLLKKFPAFAVIQASSPRSQEPTTFPYLLQIIPVHNLRTDFFKIRFNIILLSALRPSK